jgi:hypothetical protein
MADTNTLGSMLQGISQQPPHIRRDGKVTEQVNLMSDVVEGIKTRPGSKLLSVIEEGTEQVIIYKPGQTGPATVYTGFRTDGKFYTFTMDGNTYQIGISKFGIEILNQEGTLLTTNLTQAAEDYINDIAEDLAVYVYDNGEETVAYVLNRNKVVAMDNSAATIAAQEAEVVKDVGLVTSLGGQFSHTYSVYVNYDAGSFSGSYTTPNGTGSGHAAETTSDYIANQLQISLAASAALVDVNISVAVQGSVVSITGAPGITITVSDGEGGATLVESSNVAKNTDKLANTAPHGTLVKVHGLDGTADDFWMRFESNYTNTVGSGFGDEGIWREWYNVSEAAALDAETMPMKMTPNAAGTIMNIDVAPWTRRRVGDSETNPEPAFVGKKIKDISGFQSRLVTVAGPVTNFSVTNEPTDFFKNSAVAEIATDPIEIISTTADEFSLLYIVPFDRDLILFGDRVQFLVQGGSALTASNASLVQTTAYDIQDGVRPVATGRTVLFPFSIGEYGGVKEFYTSGNIEANQAISITSSVPKLIEGTIEQMKYSDTADTLLIKSSLNKWTLYGYKQLWDGEKKLQSAWFKWEFPGEIINYNFDKNKLYVLHFKGGVTSGHYGEVCQVVLDLDSPNASGLDYPLALDSYEIYDGDGTPDYGVSMGRTNMPNYTDPDGYEYSVYQFLDNNLVIIQGAGCDSPGQPAEHLTPTASASNTYTDGTAMWYDYKFPIATVPKNSTLYAGYDITSTFKPTMPFIRDSNNIVIRFIRLVISKFIVHFNNSGPMTATVGSKYRNASAQITSVRTLSNDGVGLAFDPDDPEGDGIKSGSFDVPFREQSDISELTITANGGVPININEIEWVGQVRGGRRRL